MLLLIVLCLFVGPALSHPIINGLMNANFTSHAAILHYDGSIIAKSNNFTLTAPEAQDIHTKLGDATTIDSKINIAGKPYVIQKNGEFLLARNSNKTMVAENSNILTVVTICKEQLTLDDCEKKARQYVQFEKDMGF